MRANVSTSMNSLRQMPEGSEKNDAKIQLAIDKELAEKQTKLEETEYGIAMEKLNGQFQLMDANGDGELGLKEFTAIFEVEALYGLYLKNETIKLSLQVEAHNLLIKDYDVMLSAIKQQDELS